MRELIDLVESLMTVTEMPISRYDLHGDFAQPGSFNDAHEYTIQKGGFTKDASIVSAPKAIEKIKRAFQNTPFNFTFDLVNYAADDTYWENVQTAEYQQIDWTPETLKQHFGIDITIDPNAINVVLLGNTADQRDQMSAWILAHRFVHAIWQHDPLVPTVEKLLHDTLFSKLDWKVARKIFTMRSARINQLNEPELEVVCQYLITGKVTLAHVTPRLDAKIDALERQLNAMIEHGLQRCVGKLFVWF